MLALEYIYSIRCFSSIGSYERAGRYLTAGIRATMLDDI